MAETSLRKLFHQAFPARRPGRAAAWCGADLRPAVEALEDRTLPSLLSPVPVLDPNLPASASSGGVSQPDISYDGRYIAYTGTAPSLVPGQVNEAPVSNIYLFDTQTQTTTLVSHVPGQAATGADAPCGFATISGNDRYVLYESQATDLVPGQTGLRNGVRGLVNIFLYDVATGTNTLVSHALGAPTVTGNDDSFTQGTTGFGFTQNGGRYLLFLSRATDLVAGQDRASHFNLFVYDTQAQTTTLVSHAPGSTTGGSDDTLAADISQDGSFIVYASLAMNLVTNQQGLPDNVFVYDNRPLLSGNPNPAYGENFLVSAAYDPTTNTYLPTTGVGGVSASAVSADGTFITYISTAPDLVPGQTTDVVPGTSQHYPATPNVFGRSTFSQTTYLLSGAVTPSGPSPSVTSNGLAARLAVSSDGGSVAFISTASDLYPTQTGLPGQGRNSGNVFVDRLTVGNPAQKTLVLASFDAGVFGQTGTTVPAGGVVIRNTENFTDLSMSLDGRFVTYQQQQVAGVTGPLVPGQNGTDLVWNSFIYDQQAGVNALLSRVNGTPATTGNFNSTASRVSGNGLAVAFESQATNLNPGNLNGAPIVPNGANLFVYPAFGSGPALLSSQTVVQVNAQTYVYGSSGDGRYVVFTSNSPTVVPGQVDTNADQDTFVYDRVTGTVTLVSHVAGAPLVAGNAGSPTTIDGTQPVGPPVVISQDGSWIAFVSDATNLVAGQTGQSQTNNVYLFDNRPGPTFGTVTLVTGNPLVAGQSGTGDSFNPVLSADGSSLVFVSYAANLFPGLSFSGFIRGNVYLYTRATGDLAILSDHDSTATTGNGASGSPSISDGGRYVAFASRSTNLISGTAVAATNNIYLVDTTTGQTTLVSHGAASATTSANGSSFDPVVSPDGSSVAFVSYATDLVPGQQPTPDTNVFLYTIATGAVRLVSGASGSATQPANGFSDSPALSADGGVVAFRSDAPDLVAGQVNTPGTTSNVFLFDTQTGTVTLLSRDAGSATTTAAGNSEAPGVDAAGDLVVYVSTATDLVPGQVNPAQPVNNVFLYSVPLGVNALISGQDGSATVAGTDPTYLAVISRDPVVLFNGGRRLVTGAGGTSVGYVNKLVELVLSPNTLADGSPPGSVVGSVSVSTVLVGQFRPPSYSLPAGEADNGSFALGAAARGAAPLVTEFPASYAARQSYLISVHVNIGLGDDAAILQVAVVPAGPPGPSSGRGISAQLVTVRVGRKKKLAVLVTFEGTGVQEEILSRFQKPAYRDVQATAIDSNGDGIPDEVLLTARKSRKEVAVTIVP